MAELGVFTGNDAAEVRQFENWLGKPVDGVLAYNGFRDWNDADPGWQISAGVGAAGRDMHWSLYMYPDRGSDGANAALQREVANGQHRGTHTEWARKILAADGGDDPIYVRTAWELGGEWFYHTGAAKADPEGFKEAFRQFADAFHDVSPRFKIVWDFVPDRGPVEQWYPGDEAVDVIAQDVYWHTQWDGSTGEEAWQSALNGHSRALDWMADFAAEHGKPMAIPEWGVPGADGNGYDGAKYIESMKAWIDEHDVLYADYWNDSSAYDGELSDNDPGGAAAALKRIYLENDGAPPPPPAPAGGTPATIDIGSGPDTLVLKVSQDAYNGSSQYTVKVDGVQLGGTQTASALHGSGQSDTVTLKGDWAAGAHKVEVNFLNDAYAGTAATDRNLYVDGATYNGAAVGGAAKTLLSAGSASIGFTETAPAPTTKSVTVGSGSDTLVLRISQDAYQGDAQFTVKVDGAQIGGTMTAVALHGSGQSDTVNVKGDWAAGAHKVEVSFLNDAYAGTAATDRNLYVDGATYNGGAVGGAAKTLLSAGSVGIGFTEAAATSGTATVIGAGSDALTLRISQDAWKGSAQYTVKVDGQQVGGVQTAKALHSSDGTDEVVVKGDWAPGRHTASVTFLNDDWGGSTSNDRNLYVEDASYGGADVLAGEKALFGNSSAVFTFSDTSPVG